MDLYIGPYGLPGPFSHSLLSTLKPIHVGLVGKWDLLDCNASSFGYL